MRVRLIKGCLQPLRLGNPQGIKPDALPAGRVLAPVCFYTLSRSARGNIELLVTFLTKFVWNANFQGVADVLKTEFPIQARIRCESLLVLGS